MVILYKQKRTNPGSKQAQEQVLYVSVQGSHWTVHKEEISKLILKRGRFYVPVVLLISYTESMRGFMVH